MSPVSTLCRWGFLLSAALLAGCAYLDSLPYSPDSVNDVGYGGRFRPPVW